ncbi:hypothetical protein EG328_002348 [Venturia inaequalis]|uniref:NADH-cytochrome b5 reductase n=1 Tax=Venturia inaequalis TaxID=5025 RepID=A0A8H3UWF0_VENIN|nr:hypothetical protein EG328_002348 [Venturia inaequalis]KAE9981976.1 hypothetical protein EG327_006040 [Venturia inaequalis]RDI82848.1 hypothetical protein Vi05172_g7132 [Venturia inaequalis]
MFARSAFRSATAVKSQIRRYASEAPAKSSSLPYAAAGAAILGVGGYYTLYRDAGHAPSASEAKESIKSVVGAEPKKAFTGGDQGFISLKLESVENINSNTKKFRFALPEEDAVSGLKVASALLTKYQGPEMEKPAVRPYTPVSDEGEIGYLDLLVKKYPNGAMSTHMHDMTPGQRLDFKGPIPKFPWTANKHEHIALISGGTGITPMYQLTRAIFQNPEDTTKVTLVFGNVSEQDILLKKEFDELENTYPRRFKAFYVLDNPPETWQAGKGFITKDLLKTVLPEPKEADKIKLFVCGPPGLVKAIAGSKKGMQQGDLDGYLKELGYSQDQVYKF